VVQAVLAVHRVQVVANQRVRLSQQVRAVVRFHPVRSIVRVGAVDKLESNPSQPPLVRGGGSALPLTRGSWRGVRFLGV
jgi:hypothetical protein